MENKTAVLRVIDANFNRLREGLRVLEEVERLVRNSAPFSRKLKSLRHETSVCESLISRSGRLKARNSEEDVGRNRHIGLEMKRDSLAEVGESNFKRCQEASRVLEEFLKLIHPAASKKIKAVRFALYDFEKRFSRFCGD